ncbi:MAG: aminotransferase class I/II-fold pyridoxal phosphate-dependent enzyme [Acidobacteriota bacterium]
MDRRIDTSAELGGIDPDDIRICLDGAEGAPHVEDVTPPIAQAAIFPRRTFRGLLDALSAEHRNAVYTRGQNPTVEAVERQIAALERGEVCKCFGSGMAAIHGAFFGLLEAGDHVLFVNQIYGPALQLAQHLERFGITHDVILDLDPAAAERALRPSTRLIWFENPGTMTFRTLDVAALAALGRDRGIWTAIDNSWATPLFHKPLTLGVDLVMHAASKYIGGHSDVIAGALVGSAELMERIFYHAFLLAGGILHPFDAWLLGRGLKTLPTRMRQHQADGLAVARFLASHPKVARVHHPGLGGTLPPDLLGTSGLFAFELESADFASVERLIDGLERFRIAVSWGGTESLVISPNRGDNGDALRQQGISPGLVRLSVGLEGAEALRWDLERALEGV